MTHPIAGGTSSQRWLLSLILAVIGFQCAFAQDVDWNHYEPVKAASAIPEDMRMTSSDKYERDLKQVDQSKKKRQQETHERFLLQSNFQLDEILLSGKVIFNDPITQYVTKVKDIILKGEPELQKQIRVYVVKSPVVNAFATNSGVLLVNMGLIAHLRTEADLAVVLCHEIQHYIKKHPLNTYMNANQLKDNAKMLGLKNTEDYLAAKARYSREVETEADGMGFELYKNSGYTRSAAETVFDILLGADRPFDELPWDKGYFEDEYLRFPARYDKWPLNEPHFKDPADDSLSTHPSVDSRRKRIAERIVEAGDDQGEDFQVGIQDFLEVRKRCRFELSDLYLRYCSFEEAIYNSYLLLQEEPESQYLHKNIAKAMYGLAMHKSSRKFSLAHIPSAEMGGEIQQLLRFVECLDNAALWIVSLKNVWKTYLRDPADEEMKGIALEMLDIFHQKHYESAQWLEKTKPEEFPEGLRDVLVERGRMAGLRDSLLALEKRPSVDSLEEMNDSLIGPPPSKERNHFMKWALVDLFENKLFADEWEKRSGKAKVVEDEEEYESYFSRSSSKKAKLRGYRLGIDKIVMVQPVYRIVDRLDKKNSMQYLASEEALSHYRDQMKTMASMNGIQLILLENRNLQEGEVNRFNDAATVMRWISTQLELEDREVDMQNMDKSAADSMIAKYGTKYFGFNAVVNVRDKLDKGRKFLLAFATIYVPLLLPYTIVRFALPVNHTYFATFVFDLEKSELLMQDFRYLRADDKKAIADATIYDQFYQIKTKPKKK